VGNHRCVSDKVDEVGDDQGKHRFAGKKFVVEAVDGISILGHQALRIDVALKRLTGRDVVLQFDAADLNNAVERRVQSGRFGIENNFAQGQAPLSYTSSDVGRSILTMSRIACKDFALSPPVGMTKSARWRFSASGIC